MKTDPQNSDYVVEAGATRNFEPWRNEDEVKEKQKKKRIIFRFPCTVITDQHCLTARYKFCFQELDKEKQKRESEEMGDAMKSLENRTQDSKREMDIMAALDEMKSMKVGA